MDVDLKQQLIYVQMCMKEIGASVSGLEGKIDSNTHSLSSIEQQLLQMKQLQIFAKMDKAPGLVEVDNLLKKNIQQALALQADQSSQGTQQSHQHQLAIYDQQSDSLKRLEQGVADLLEKSINGAHSLSAPENKYVGGFPGLNQLASSLSTAGTATAVDHVGISSQVGAVRQELSSFQASLMAEMKSQQQALEHFTTQSLERQEALMQEFKQSPGAKSSRLPPPPQQLQQQPFGSSGQPGMADVNRDFSDVRMQLGGVAGDVGLTPRMDVPDMRDIVAPLQGDPAQEVTKRAFDSCLSSDSDGMPIKGQISPECDNVTMGDQEDAVELGKKAPSPIDELLEEEEEASHVFVVCEQSGLAAVFSNDGDLQSPPYHVEDAYWKTGICQKIARSDQFANFTVLVVMFNAVYIGFDSDYNDASNIYRAAFVFQACSQFFCVYFTWELVVRFFAFQIKHDTLKDGWFKFDAFLVSTMILDTWLLMPTLYIMGGGVQIPTQPLRMLRLFKLTRMARLMKALPELVTQIKGLFRSLRAISSSMILVGLMVYVWAIMMHMLLKEEVEYNAQLWEQSSLGFSTMTQCIWTLLMAGTMMLDDASPLMSSLLFSGKFTYVLAGFLFIAYTLMSAMCILQMLIGVLCDVVSTVKAEEQSASAIGLLKQELLASLTACDDGDGKISQEEMKGIMHAPKSKALFKRLKVNHAFLVELLSGLYKRPGSSVPIQEILELMVQCRGENAATVETMSGALVRIINELSSVKTVIEKDIASMETRLAMSVNRLSLR